MNDLILSSAKILEKAQNIDLVWLSLKKSCSCYAPVSDWEYSDMFLNMFKTFLIFQKCPRHILACFRHVNTYSRHVANMLWTCPFMYLRGEY